MANPVFGEGSSVEVDDGASSAFVAVDDLTGITPPDQTVVTVADRNLLSNTTAVEPAFSTRKNLGQLQFTYENKYANVSRIEALKGVAHSWKVKLTDGTQWAFTGVLTGNAPQGIAGGAITTVQATVTITSLFAVTDLTP